MLFQIFSLHSCSLYSLYSLYILYDFSGHKPDLEGKIQICFRYGFSRPVSAQCANTDIASLLDLTSMCLLRRQVSENLNSLYTESPGFFRPATWVKHSRMSSTSIMSRMSRMSSSSKMSSTSRMSSTNRMNSTSRMSSTRRMSSTSSLCSLNSLYSLNKFY